MLTDSQIAQVIGDILEREGGYVDRPDDPGGATNFGITQSTADEFGIGSVKNMTRDNAISVYKALFHEWGIYAIADYYVFALVADCCVNHGSGRGVRWLQRALGIVDDGVIGPQTEQALDAVAAAPRGWQSIYASVLFLRIQFYGVLLGEPRYSVFASGWLNRAASFLRPWPYTV